MDGGIGTDTVVAFQFNTGFGSRNGDLGDAIFKNIERLEVGANITFAAISQLNAFGTITGGNSNGLIMFDVRSGAGGMIDFSEKLHTSTEEAWLRCYGATSAVDLTGTNGNDTLTGSVFNDTLSGGAGDDYLGGADFSAGASGKDMLHGGTGSDTYYIDSTDRLFDLVGPDGGIDTVISITSCDLANSRKFVGEFENLSLNGQLGAENPNIHGYGNSLDNVITGNDGNNLLDGRAGSDRLIGGDGNDRYFVDSVGDIVEESQFKNRGRDTVTASVSFDLGNSGQALGFVENLVLLGNENLDAYGNEYSNRLTGNAGNNVLDGRGGRDVMKGLGGNDSYYIDQGDDKVIEADHGGIDRVFTSVTFRLGAQSIEVLTLAGDANIGGVGNSLDNFIFGNGADNFLAGKEGVDTLHGGEGNDSIAGGAGADFINGEGGSDTFHLVSLADSGVGEGDMDRIQNFETGDRINVAKIDASGSQEGDQVFVLDNDGSFSEGEIRQTVQGPNILVEFNTDGDQDAEMAILLTSRAVFLQLTDFVL